MRKKTGCLVVATLTCLLGAAVLRAQSDAEWHYSVKRGDNPWNITERLLDGMRYWPQVQQRNGITDPLNIAPGTVLRIPIGWLRKEAGFAVVLSTSSEGCLVLAENGANRPVRDGDKLGAGTALRSVAGGRCSLRFPDQSRILLLEDSELRLERIISYALTGMHDIATRLLRGRAEATVTPASGPASRFEINAPQGVTSVRGTRYRVASQDTGARAEVLEGGVEVRNGAGQVALDAGTGTVFTATTPPAPPVRLLDAPALAGLPGEVRGSQSPLAFPAVAGASGYRQQFALSATFDLPLSDQRTTDPALTIPRLAEGDYHYRVRAIDALDLEGHDATGALRIVHLLPAPAACTPSSGQHVQAGAVNAVCAPVPAARWYRVQMARDAGFAVPQTDLLSSTPAAALPLDRPGQYYWRVAAIDDAGREGDFTEAMALVRAPVPPSIELVELGRDSLTFAWPAHDDAHDYRLQLASDADFRSLIEDRTTRGVRLVVARPPLGTYYARLAMAVEAGGEPLYGPVHGLNLPASGALDWLAPVGLLFLFAL